MAKISSVTLRGADVVGSDEWWVRRLSTELRDRRAGKGWSSAKVSNPLGTRPGLDLLAQWGRGEQPLPLGADESYVSAWSNFLRASRTNYAELVVSSRTERITPIGWRTAVESGRDTDGDEVAERLATHTDLRARVTEAVEDMCTLGEGYLMVGPDEVEDGRALITRESPLETLVARDVAGRPRAGLRHVVDEWTGVYEVILYRAGAGDTPNYMRTARRVRGRWSWAGDPVTLPDFPIVPFENYRGLGEFELHLDALGRINDSVFTRMVLTKLQAHRQRAVERPMPTKDGIEIDAEIAPEDFVSGPDALWDLPPGVKIWESSAADFSTVRLHVEDDVKALCAVTKTPVWQMLPGSQNQSATGSDRAHEGFLSLVEDRRHRVNVGLSKVLGMAFDVIGDSDRSDASKIETIWAPTERYGLQERAQALATMHGKWPFEEIAVDVMQKRPSELSRLNSARLKDSFTTNVVAGNGDGA